LLDVGQDESGFYVVADPSGTGGDPAHGPPAAGKQGEAAFAAAAGGPVQAVVGLVVRGQDLSGGRAGYRAAGADRSAAAGRERPKKLAVERSPRLRAVVVGLLHEGWSPASIAGRLPINYAEDQACRVSHEAIYQWIYATPVSTLARELIRLRTGRTARRGGRRPPPAPRIKDPVYIEGHRSEHRGPTRSPNASSAASAANSSTAP
jgi:hypothetical protein